MGVPAGYLCAWSTYLEQIFKLHQLFCPYHKSQISLCGQKNWTEVQVACLLWWGNIQKTEQASCYCYTDTGVCPWSSGIGVT